MTNWKTTLGGILIAVAPVIRNTVTWEWSYYVAELCIVVGGFLLGKSASDEK